MGCDIHCYVEYRQPKDERWDFFGGRINPGRNYSLFARMAGVRGGPALFERRGAPEDMGWRAYEDYWLRIDYTGSGEGSRECTPAEAERYAKYGRKYRGDYRPRQITSTNADGVTTTALVGAEFDGKPTHIEHPDWHSASWLTVSEFASAIGETREPEYRALLAAMNSLRGDGYEVRLVFWFDN